MATITNQKASPGREFRSLFLPALALLCSLSIFSIPASYAEPEPATSAVVNINVADAKALATGLKGVGLTRAEDIIRYREQYGPFTTLEQLAEVKGIGSATIENNRNRITLD